MLRTAYLSFLFMILLELRWWELPREPRSGQPRLRSRLSKTISRALIYS